MPRLKDIGNFEDVEISENYLKYHFKTIPIYNYIHVDLEVSKGWRANFSSITLSVDDYENKDLFFVSMFISILVKFHGFKIIWIIKRRQITKPPVDNTDKISEFIRKMESTVKASTEGPKEISGERKVSFNIDHETNSEDEVLWLDEDAFRDNSESLVTTLKAFESFPDPPKIPIVIENGNSDIKIKIHIVLDSPTIITKADILKMLSIEYLSMKYLTFRDFDKMYFVKEIAQIEDDPG